MARDLNTLLRTFVHSDGTWARCNRCNTQDAKAAYWGLFRDDAFILAKAQKHMAKVHAPKAAPEAKVRDVVFAPKPMRKPQNPAPTHQPNTDDIVAAIPNPEALLDQAIRDLQLPEAA